MEHALSRFSTDNLSVMVVRLDKKAMQEFAKKPPPVNRNSKRISEAENLVELAKKNTPSAESPNANAQGTSIAEALEQELGPETSLPEDQDQSVSLASALESSQSQPNDTVKPDPKDESKPNPK